jgi:hypothetical protein
MSRFLPGPLAVLREHRKDSDPHARVQAASRSCPVVFAVTRTAGEAAFSPGAESRVMDARLRSLGAI